jgi:hypothetical protein
VSANSVSTSPDSFLTSSAKAADRFGKQDLVYDAAVSLPRRRDVNVPVHERGGRQARRYWTAACQTCALKARCTPGKERRISGWEHEAVLETVQDRLDCNPDNMRVRRQTVEHPFGSIKAWMGATQFQIRGLPKVAREMALHVVAHKMKRVMQILGVCGLMPAGPEARLGAPKSTRADGHSTSSGLAFPKIRRADPSNPRRRRRISNRGTKRARSHTA